MTTSISSVPRSISLETFAATPFCDKRFQTLRVLTNTITSVCLAIFYKMLSWFCWVGSESLSHRYGSLATYQFEHTLRLFTYFNHGGQIIDFASNTPTRVKEMACEEELVALKKIYGEEAISDWSQIGNEEIQLKQEKLARREMAEEGCCLGMSFDFISHYLKKIKEGMSPLEAVKTIAPRYVDGAPDKAQLAQIFYEALDSSLATENAQKKWDALFEACKDQFKNKMKAEQSKILSSSENNLEDAKKRLAELTDRLSKEMAETKEALLKERIITKTQLGFQREKMVAEKMGLAAELAGIYAIEEARDEEMDSDFAKFLDERAEGTYQIVLSPQEGNGHALALIKTQDQYFIHEPNFATLAINKEEAAKELWRVGKKFYLKNGLCSLTFNLCTDC